MRSLLVLALFVGCHQDEAPAVDAPAPDVDALMCERKPADDAACNVTFPYLGGLGYACVEPTLSCFLGNGMICCAPYKR